MKYATKIPAFITPLNVLAIVALLVAIIEAIVKDVDGWWIGGCILLIVFVTIPSLSFNVVIDRMKINKQKKLAIQLAIVGAYLYLFFCR